MQGGGDSGVGDWPPALAYWLTQADVTAITAAATRRVHESQPPPALLTALCELDAAAVRLRWFDPPSAARHRRTLRAEPATIVARLTGEERDALIACDPPLVTPLLDATTRRDPWIGGSAPQPSSSPITLPTAPRGPVVVLTHDPQHGLAWALGQIDSGKLRTWRPDPDDASWDQACREAHRTRVDAEPERTARRLIVRAHPALSSAALARPELRPGAGEAVLLNLPSSVVIAPESLAVRVAAYAYPVNVILVRANTIPAVPGRAGVAL